MARPQRRTTAAAGALSPVTLSVFDLDRTLTRLPTYSRFLLFAARSRAPWRLLLLPLLLPVALLYALKIVPRRTMKQAMHRIAIGRALPQRERSEEHTSELQSLMRISYAVFCLTTQKHRTTTRLNSNTSCYTRL